MRTFIYLIFIALLLTGCAKDKQDGPKVSDLEPLAEKDLTISNGKMVYTDESDNEYYTVVFDKEHISHIYKVELQEGKNYMISLLGHSSSAIEMFLLVSSKDTLYHGVEHWGEVDREYINFKPAYTGTFYIATNYVYDINFFIEEYRLIVEELKTEEVTYNNLSMLCCGDWFVNKEGYLALALHETGITKWARINKPYSSYQFSYDVTQVSGYPDNYIGIMCCASITEPDVRGIPSNGYAFDVRGPAQWRISFHNSGGTGYDYGYLTNNLTTGQEQWHNIGVQISGDYISFTAGGDEMYYLRNTEYLDIGLYILVDDIKQDTILFKNVNLTF